MNQKRTVECQIAEQCFGYTRKPVPPDGHGKHGEGEYLWPPDMPPDYDLPKLGPIAFHFLVPRWAETREKAWELLDRLTAREVEVRLGIFPPRNPDVKLARYCIELSRWRDRRADGIPGDPHTHRSRETFVVETGEDLPLLICTAFLRAWPILAPTRYKTGKRQGPG